MLLAGGSVGMFIFRFSCLTNHPSILLGLMQSPVSAASLSATCWGSDVHSIHIHHHSGCVGERWKLLEGEHQVSNTMTNKSSQCLVLGERWRTGGILGNHVKWVRFQLKEHGSVTFKPALIKVLTGICWLSRLQRQLYKRTSFLLFYYVTNLHCWPFKTARQHVHTSWLPVSQ